MKKKDDARHNDELRPEYDLSKLKDGVRGKYAKRYRAGTNIVRLEPDVAQIFRNDASVNKALRSLIKIAEARVPYIQSGK
jgi:hypothetical protein